MLQHRRQAFNFVYHQMGKLIARVRAAADALFRKRHDKKGWEKDNNLVPKTRAAFRTLIQIPHNCRIK